MKRKKIKGHPNMIVQIPGKAAYTVAEGFVGTLGKVTGLVANLFTRNRSGDLTRRAVEYTTERPRRKRKKKQ